MVQARFDVSVDLPILSPEGYRRFQEAARLQATKDARRLVARPVRRYLPVRSGRLKRRFRAQNPRRLRREAVGAFGDAGGTFTLVVVAFLFYLIFQEEENARFRADITEAADNIVVIAVEVGLRGEGFRR